MSLRKEISSTQDSYERLKLLKDRFKGETIYIVTPGPSLTKHNREKLLEKLKGKPVIALKQSYEYVKEVATIHGMSCYSYQPYEYYSEDTLVTWQLTAMNAQWEVNRIQNEWKHRNDILIPCYSTPWIPMEKTTAFSREFDNWLAIEEGKLIWGPGIIYETGFPLAIHLGAKKIVTIGWDIGDLNKFKPETGYKLGDDWHEEHASSLYKIKADGGPDYKELKETIDCTKEMYDWLQTKDIEVNIVSDTNPADKRFKRVTLDEL